MLLKSLDPEFNIHVHVHVHGTHTCIQSQELTRLVPDMSSDATIVHVHVAPTGPTSYVYLLN